jgi:type II secretory pathway pseudopilin PulG
MRRRVGFTMLEIMVAVVIILTLTALLIPAVGGVRDLADRAAAMSNARQLMTGLQLYMGDHELRYPFAGVSGDPRAPLNYNGTRVPTALGGMRFFRAQSQYWTTLIRPHLSSTAKWEREGFMQAVSSSILPMTPPKDDAVYSCNFAMTETAFADPDFFTSAGPHTDDMLRGTRLNDVKQPARKGAIIGDVRYGGPNDTVVLDAVVGFCDGSVVVKPWTTRSFDPPDLRFLLDYHLPIMTTEGGMAGIDF